MFLAPVWTHGGGGCHKGAVGSNNGYGGTGRVVGCGMVGVPGTNCVEMCFYEAGIVPAVRCGQTGMSPLPGRWSTYWVEWVISNFAESGDIQLSYRQFSSIR